MEQREDIEYATTESKKAPAHKPRGVARKTHWAAVVILCILPAFIALAYIHAYGVNVVFWDEFQMVPLFERYYQGTLTFHDFYAQHNEHRLFFPRLLMLPLGLATRCNTVAEMYVGWGFLCLSALPLYLFCRRLGADPLAGSAAFIPAAWILFNLRQSENLLWGWQLLFFMSVTFFLLSMHYLEKARRLDGWLLAAAAAGVVATFSFSSMLLLWPIGLAMILMNRSFREAERRRELLTALSFWGILGAVVWLSYFAGYTRPAKHPGFLFGLAHPLEFFRYLGLYLGNPLGRGMILGTILGLILLVSYLGIIVLAYRKWRTRDPLPILPTAMILFVVGSAVITAVARVGFGSGQAMAPRYVTFSSLGLIGLYLTVLSLKPRFRLRIRKYDATPIFVGLILLLVVYPMYNRAEGIETRSHRSRVAYYLSNTALQSDSTLQTVLNSPSRVRRGAEILRRYKLNVFATELLELSTLPRTADTNLQYAIDLVNGELVGNPPRAIQIGRQADAITLVGWARDGAAKRPARAVFVELDGRLDIPGLYGLPRRDVAEHFKSRHHRYGFEITFAKVLLTEGRHSLRLKMVSADGTSYCVAEEPLTLEVP